MPKAKSEYEVEELYIDRLDDMGYKYINLKNYDDVCTNFKEQFCKLNAKKLIAAKGKAELSDSEFDRVMLRLENHTIYESAKILREQWVLELDSGETVYVEFFTNDETRNIYQVTHQVTMDPAHKDDVLYKNRYDVTILINGLPLVQTELKRPGIEINEAVNQINRYRRFSFRGLFRFIQLFVVSNSTMTKYCANINENDQFGHKQDILKSLTFFWTDENNVRVNKLMDFTNTFLTKFHLTEMLSKYFVIKDTEPVLMIMRPYQVYAVKRAFDRIIMANMNGYVFHTTGSGKTLTSYKLASLLRDDRRIDKVFFLIDRNDLDDQTVDEYNSFEAGCVDQTDSTYNLVKNLQDSSKTLIITTIQKMATALRSEKYDAIMDTFKQQKCVFIIDECHRSQFGKMNAQIRKHFQNSNYIGFTGTPIFKENKGPHGQTTADIFHSGKLDPCIHKYMIKEAIADGNVLRFSVEYMRSISVTNIKDSKIDPKALDDAEYCKRHKIDLDELYHSDERIAAISEDILEHLNQHTRLENNNVYTAIFAIDKIETLVKYYNYMKAHNPKGYKIAAIFTYQANQDMEERPDKHAGEHLEVCMKDYNDMFGTDYDLSKFDAYRKDISKRMKQKDLPQVDLLLVVNMFLTGFDSKPTNTLYLDKNLVWHSLVQAYSRTNRVDKVTKQFGQIVTYRNIKRAQDNALKLYSGDGDPNAYLLQSYDFYVAEYYKQVDELRSIVPTPDDAGNLQSEDDIRAFVITFRKLAGILSTLKTFSKFDWADLAPALDEDEYADYKSWYLYYYDKHKGDGKQSILVDVDFNIELVRTDKINVVYILNLLKDINRNNKDEMAKSIDLILREIERSDNEKMRYKRDIMKAFVTERFFDLDPDVDIIEAYNEYEREVLQADIESFATENSLTTEFVSRILHQYFMDTKAVTKETLRQELSSAGVKGLVRITTLIGKVQDFLTDSYNKFTAEGE
ncbi:MAG: type I restriction endonuclease subunit R [Erysipelotrichaceae bacterium]|nr:type I restriction endonuclease subunit R [Erysipelotrichaceae bacterium]